MSRTILLARGLGCGHDAKYASAMIPMRISDILKPRDTGPNENKMSDGWRESVSLRVERGSS
jgi:hypothetical protein